jgi:hypothetical protein
MLYLQMDGTIGETLLETSLSLILIINVSSFTFILLNLFCTIAIKKKK